MQGRGGGSYMWTSQHRYGNNQRQPVIGRRHQPSTVELSPDDNIRSPTHPGTDFFGLRSSGDARPLSVHAPAFPRTQTPVTWEAEALRETRARLENTQENQAMSATVGQQKMPVATKPTNGASVNLTGITDPRVLREISDKALSQAKAIEEEQKLTTKIEAFSREHRVAISHLLQDCYICTEPIMKGLGGSDGDFGVVSWKCSCTTWRVTHCSCLAQKMRSNGYSCDYCRTDITNDGFGQGDQNIL